MRRRFADTRRLEALYGLALRLYPARFREAYGPLMQQAFRDALRDHTLSQRVFIPLIFRDLLISLAREHLAMLRESLARPALLFNAAVLAGISRVLALALYTIPQQVLRLGANDPQVQLAGDLKARLEQGATPAEAVSAASIDMARSLAPFVIVYDDQGRPVASQATLNGSVPAPPSGVFDFVRTHGEERVSWQPVRGSAGTVRIAAVVMRINGAHSGFVLAGRSLREVEAREELVGHLAGLTWLAMLGLIAIGTLAFGWYTRPKTA